MAGVGVALPPAFFVYPDLRAGPLNASRIAGGSSFRKANLGQPAAIYLPVRPYCGFNATASQIVADVANSESVFLRVYMQFYIVEVDSTRCLTAS